MRYLSEINVILVSCRSRFGLLKFRYGNAGDFSEAAGEREMALKCGSQVWSCNMMS